MNEGGHRVDLATRTIFNDEHWKGWLPKGLRRSGTSSRGSPPAMRSGSGNRATATWARRSTWTAASGSSTALEEFTLDRPVNDLDPGQVHPAALHGPGVRAPVLRRHEGGRRRGDRLRRLHRTVSRRQARLHRPPDATLLVRRARRARSRAARSQGQAAGEGRPERRLARRRGDDVQSRDAGRAPLIRPEDRRQGRHASASRSDHPEVLVPTFVIEHFSTDDSTKLERELRRRSTTRRWWARGVRRSARCMRGSSSATPGLFRRDADKASRRYTMRYMLTRTE